jgi:hypothetical protein
VRHTSRSASPPQRSARRFPTRFSRLLWAHRETKMRPIRLSAPLNPSVASTIPTASSASPPEPAAGSPHGELGWQRRGYPLAVEGRHPGSTTPAGFWCVVVVGGQIEGPHRRRAWIYTPSTRRSASSLLAPVLDWRRRHLDPPPRCGISSTDSRPPATRWPRTGGGLRCSATTSGTWTRTTWRWTPGSTASASASLPSPTSRWRSSARAPWVLPHP